MRCGQCWFMNRSCRTSCNLFVCLTMHVGVLTVALADDSIGSRQPTARGIAPTKLPRVSWQIDLHPQVAKSVRDELLVEADEKAVAGPTNRRAAKTEDVISFRGNVRVRLKDESVTVNAEQVTVSIEYPTISRTKIDMVTVTLSGNARGNSDGVDVTGDELKLLVKPIQRDEAAARHVVEWKLRGDGEVEGRNFSGKADRVELMSYQEKGPSQERRMKVVLDGNVQLRGKSGRSSFMNGSRIEISPVVHGELPLGR